MHSMHSFPFAVLFVCILCICSNCYVYKVPTDFSGSCARKMMQRHILYSVYRFTPLSPLSTVPHNVLPIGSAYFPLCVESPGSQKLCSVWSPTASSSNRLQQTSVLFAPPPQQPDPPDGSRGPLRLHGASRGSPRAVERGRPSPTAYGVQWYRYG